MKHVYRAWNTNKKIMYSPETMGADQLTLSVDGRGMVNVHGGDHDKSQFYGHIIPLQWTGLKDMNGKRIFEGDIVDFRGITRLVKYDSEFAQFSTAQEDDEDGEYLGEITRCAVLGNAYENPDF